uniref:RSE1/DDB1/CPSF1 C-terminal domain-containing protein n=2 Tax=Corethron hystrix TaxID=216773 RepID=A0A7S1BI36_9STRA
MTIHARIGRVGSQRITVFSGLSDVLADRGFLPGGGLAAAKIPLGVTVRHLALVDDPSLPLPPYALLVVREVEANVSAHIDDGLTSDERTQRRAEAERLRTQRQVEADLGGFDVDAEWVEEIERNDFLTVDQAVGGCPPATVEMCEVWLVRPGTWEVLDKHALGEYEHGMSLNVLPLTTEAEGKTGMQTNSTLFVVVGTGIVDQDGEDIGSKGRVLLFEVKKPKENVNAASPLSLSLTYSKDILLGPVTVLEGLKTGNQTRLVIGAGAEVTVEQWKDQQLTQIGFFHAQMQVQGVTMFKTFMLLSDAYDSIHFLVWRESDKSLTLLAKDYEPTCVYAAGFINRGPTMYFVCHDDRENLQFFQYAPTDPASRGGNKLVCRADYHLGTQTTHLRTHLVRNSLLLGSATPATSWIALRHRDAMALRQEDPDCRRFGVHFGTVDGGFGAVFPVNERTFRRLYALQGVVGNALQQSGALNVRGWRLFQRTTQRGACRSGERQKGVLDGGLLMRYCQLGYFQQEEIARAIGTTVDMIMDNLLELDCARMVL